MHAPGLLPVITPFVVAGQMPPIAADVVSTCGAAVVQPFDLADVTLGPDPFHIAMAGWIALRVDRLTPEQMQASPNIRFEACHEWDSAADDVLELLLVPAP